MGMKIGVIRGDGIGPEVVNEAVKVLDRAGEVYGLSCDYTDILMGGCSIDATGVPLTDEAIETAKAQDAVLMGSIGGNTQTSPWYRLPPDKRPEAGLLKLRKSLGLFANLRPARLYDELREACPLKEKTAAAGFDLVMVRELTGGLYFGHRETKVIDGKRTAIDTLTYNEASASTRRTSWILQDSGVRWFPKWRRITRRSHYPLCWWTTAPCSLSRTLPSSTWS